MMDDLKLWLAVAALIGVILGVIAGLCGFCCTSASFSMNMETKMGKTEAHFEIYSKKTIGFRKKWYWRFRARNGEIVAHGEGYTNKEDCYRAVSLMQSTSILTPVQWLSPQ